MASSRNLPLNWSSDLFVIALIAFVSIFFFAFAIGKIGNYFHDPENKIPLFFFWAL